MPWLALHFPLLPLDALACRSSPDGPRAVAARGRIVVADPAAAAAGVVPGLRLSAALGLVPGLLIHERDAGRESARLDTLACWAGRFTPRVSSVPPASLLLDLAGCLRLFGGLENLHAQVRSGASDMGFTARSAVAPTPLGALWLAWAGDGAVCRDAAELFRSLARLPVSVPGWASPALARLQAYGLATLGELLALPRAELSRRIGPGPADELARALGERPDLRPAFVFPETFSHALELPARVDSADMLAFAGQRLLAALCGWLAARGAGVETCQLRLVTDGGGTLDVELRPARATRDEARLVRLLRERLARLDLPAPVSALELHAGCTVPLPGEDAPLFAHDAPDGEGALAAVERLLARLGEDKVYALAVRADHRPECATARHQPDGSDPEHPPGSGHRPLWLLPAPKPLADIDGRPHCAGPLVFLAGPERIESGWWDEGEGSAAPGDLRRDYLVAANPQGQRLWVFRDAGGWFLHGVFA